MKRMILREFGSMDLCGRKYILDLNNQTKDYKDRRQYVIEDKRVFDNILIALNPDCIKFTGNDGSCLTIDGVSHINIISLSDDNSFLFDVVCDIAKAGNMTLRFLSVKS